MKRIIAFFVFSIISFVSFAEEATAATPTVAIYSAMSSFAKDCAASNGTAYSFNAQGANKQYIDADKYSQLYADKMTWIKEEHARRGIPYPANLNRDLTVEAAKFQDSAKAAGQLVCYKNK